MALPALRGHMQISSAHARGRNVRLRQRDTSRGCADVSETGNESQNVTDFAQAAARRAAYGRLPVVGVAARAVPEGVICVWPRRLTDARCLG
jgi:hypothetical protein